MKSDYDTSSLYWVRCFQESDWVVAERDGQSHLFYLFGDESLVEPFEVGPQIVLMEGPPVNKNRSIVEKWAEQLFMEYLLCSSTYNISDRFCDFLKRSCLTEMIDVCEAAKKWRSSLGQVNNGGEILLNERSLFQAIDILSTAQATD